MARRRFVEYPRVVYGPHGATMTINGPFERPDGWTNTPERDIGEVIERAKERPPFTRPELKKMLRTAGITFDETAADSALYQRLQDG